MNVLKRRVLVLAILLTVSTGAFGQGISIDDSVLTQHNDRRRTGVYNHEAILSHRTVSPSLFNRLVVRKVEGQVATQPLFVKGVTIDGKPKNVLYVVTRKNLIYAFDTDNTDQQAPNNGMAWSNVIELTYKEQPTGRQLKAAPLPGMDDGAQPCLQTHGPVGITSTPVIDPVSHLMYVVFRVAPPPPDPPDADPKGYGKIAYHFVAAIDIRNGQEVRRTRIETNNFDANSELNRPGLLLMRNPLTQTNVFTWLLGRPCDSPIPFDGWVFAYSAPDLRLLDTYITAPQTHGAGIWQSGGGLAGASVDGAVYATTGNNIKHEDIAANQTGVGDARDDLYHFTRTDLGESVLKLKLGPDDKFVCDHRYVDHDVSHCVAEHFTAGN